ncbi:MAG: MerR family transcriptional regulator [Acidimicrobiales bacterium]
MPPDSTRADQMHQIGEVADAVGLSLRTIRHYEEVGVVVPSGRSTGGFRLYTDEDVDRLRMVRRMKPLDLTLEEIREVLALLDRVDEEPGDASAREQLATYAALAVERCERLRSRLALAMEFTDALGRAVEGASPSSRGRRARSGTRTGTT